MALFFNIVIAQSQPFNFVKFNQNEGLNHSQITDISQDKNGNLWLGTPTRSIYRFDGKKFYEHKIYIPGNNGTLRTLKIQPDFNNGIWILSNLGVIKFNGSNSQPVPGSDNISLGASSILSLDSNNMPWGVDERGDVFTITNDSIVVLSEVRKKLQHKVKGFLEDVTGEMCFYSIQGLAVRLTKSGQVVNFDLPWQINGNIQTVYRSNQKYLIATSVGIFEFLEDSAKLIKVSPPIKQGVVSKMFYDRNGIIWGKADNRIFTINRNSLQWLSGYSRHENNDVTSLFMDKDSDVWIAVDIIGLLKYREQTWNKIEGTEGKHITAMLERPTDKKLIFGTYGDGILGLDADALVGKPVTSLSMGPDGNILAGTLKAGLFEIKDKAIKNIPLSPSLLNQDVYGVRCWGNRTIVGAQEGLFIIRPNYELKKYLNPYSKSNDVSNPIVIEDNIYFSGMTSGLMKLANDSIIQIGPDFLKNSLVYNIKKYIGGGYLVTGEFPSILFFDDSFTFTRSINLDTVASNVLLVEFVDANNFILGSNDGLFKIGLAKDAIASVKKYGRADGYAGDEMYVGSSIYSSKGEVIIGTVGGAYNFNPKNQGHKVLPPSTYITEVKAATNALSEKEEGYIQLPKNLSLNYDENTITFSFDATSLANPYNIKFQHRLIGLEREWSSPMASQQVTYSNLPHGKFIFQVQSMDENMEYGEIAEYSFFIAPAFWQTPIFYFSFSVSLILLTFLIIWSVSAYRISRHKTIERIKTTETQRIRKQMSMDFHDEMGNKLASMLAQASLLKIKHSNTELYKNFDFFERNAYAIYHGTKDFIWMIDIRSNNLNEIILYLRDFGFNFFERNRIQFKFSHSNYEESNFEEQLPDGFNRQLVLIFKEAMTNSLKHSGCSAVSFSANKTGDTFEIAFEDDGTWKESNEASNGISNMMIRAEKINAKLAFAKNPTGTRVTIYFNGNHSI